MEDSSGDRSRRLQEFRATAAAWLSEERISHLDATGIEEFLGQLDWLLGRDGGELLYSCVIERLIDMRPEAILTNLSALPMHRREAVGRALWERRSTVMGFLGTQEAGENVNLLLKSLADGAMSQGCSAGDLRDLIFLRSMQGHSVLSADALTDILVRSCKAGPDGESGPMDAKGLLGLVKSPGLNQSEKLAMFEVGLEYHPDTFLGLLGDDEIAQEVTGPGSGLARGFGKGAVRRNPIAAIRSLSVISDEGRRKSLVQAVVREWLDVDSYGAANAVSSQLDDSDLRFAALEIQRWALSRGDRKAASAWEAVGRGGH